MEASSAIAAILKARPFGAAMWIRVLGRSMFPVLRSGDSIRVVRCHENELSPGDIGVFRRTDGVMVAHLVSSCRPLRTVSFFGVADPLDVLVLGRATAIRRGRIRLPLPRFARLPLLLAHRAASASIQNRASKRVGQAIRDGLTSRATLPIRKAWFGRIEIRQLGHADLESAALFMGDNIGVVSPALKEQIEGGELVFGAFLRSGRLCGLSQPSKSIVSRMVSGMNVEQRLAEARRTYKK